MADRLPDYYSRLGPFLRVFTAANPVLTYHKLGPRPRGVRLKGLYVSEQLFRQQLQELRAAQFKSGSLGDCVTQPARRRVVITFDDGYENVLRYGAKTLREQGFRAVAFLVADCIGLTNEWDVSTGEVRERLMDAGQVREWIAAGHEIGSHTRTHPSLTRINLEQAQEEILGSKRKLEDLFGQPVRHFCYPYGDHSPAVAEKVREAGYETACTTQPGVNQAGDSAFTLKRFTARYRSRSLKAVWAKIWKYRRR